jgi:hypothetical protein
MVLLSQVQFVYVFKQPIQARFFKSFVGDCGSSVAPGSIGGYEFDMVVMGSERFLQHEL